ncbi:MAG: hypothetical protein NT076_04635 [Candidatus Pacearchaeota archaeon]|nr:hypothetical protein [Candidatus Pacearchaeota archaeon]
MTIKRLHHYPQLNTILMVEKTIYNRSGIFSKKQLWKKLPKKTMYQTFSVILDYLIYSGKIVIDSKKKIIWLNDSEIIKKYLSKPYLLSLN